MKFDELEDSKERKTELDNLKNQITGAEKLLQQHKTEVGEIRNIANEMKEITAMKEQLKKLVDSIANKSDNNSVKVQSAVGNEADAGKAKSQLEEVEQKMTSAQRAKADEKFKTLKPEDRRTIKADPEKRLEFFKAAIEADTEAPESLFDNESVGSEVEDKFGFKELFGIGNKVKNFVPGSRNVGASGFAGADNQGKSSESNSKRLIGGKIPRPQKEDA